jgi:predicted phosphodiesterase
MRIGIISDLHANIEALNALPDDYDELWVLGDLVNFGPDPVETIDFVRERADLVIRGNHDQSVGFDVDCGCSPRFRKMAAATRQFTIARLPDGDQQYLRELPVSARREIDGTAFFLCHATPSDFLSEYRAPDSSLWER